MKYYQPNVSSDKNPSFVVYYSLDKLKEEFPGDSYNEYRDGDIQACRFIDLKPLEILSKKEILKYIETLLFVDNLDEFKSLIDINNCEENLTFKALGYKHSDPSTNQWIKQDSDNVKLFYVFENQYLHKIDLGDYTESELEDEVSSYYENGLSDIRNTYGLDSDQIIAEIIAENS